MLIEQKLSVKKGMKITVMNSGNMWKINRLLINGHLYLFILFFFHILKYTSL